MRYVLENDPHHVSVIIGLLMMNHSLPAKIVMGGEYYISQRVQMKKVLGVGFLSYESFQAWWLIRFMWKRKEAEHFLTWLSK